MAHTMETILRKSLDELRCEVQVIVGIVAEHLQNATVIDGVMDKAMMSYLAGKPEHQADYQRAANLRNEQLQKAAEKAEKAITTAREWRS